MPCCNIDSKSLVKQFEKPAVIILKFSSVEPNSNFLFSFRQVVMVFFVKIAMNAQFVVSLQTWRSLRTCGSTAF